MNSILNSTVAIIASLLTVGAVGSAQQTSSGWARATLTGTGLSVESPVAFRLDQDKPDPFLRDTTAYVRWSLRHQGVFSTVVYEEKSQNKKTPRKSAVELAALFGGMAKPQLSRITDTTFLGQPAVLFEEESPDGETTKLMRRKMVIFGTEGKLTNVNIVYPAADVDAKTIADRLYASVLREGQVATATSKMRPAFWRKERFSGIWFETPSSEIDKFCPLGLPITFNGVASIQVCYKWGDAFTLTARNSSYMGAVRAPDPTQYAKDAVARYKEMDSESKLNAGHEYTVKPFQVAGADAAKLEQFMSVGSQGSRYDQVFVRKGSEFWTISVSYPLRYDYEKQAAERIIASVSLDPSRLTATKPPSIVKASLFDLGKEFAKKGEHSRAIQEFTAALAVDPKNNAIYNERALSRYAMRDYGGAIKDNGAAIVFGARQSETYFNRGTAYYALKNYTEAIKDFTSSINSDPNYYRSLYNRGLSYFELKQNEKAVADFTSAIKIEPKHTNSYLIRSQILCQQKLFVSAWHDEDAAVALGAKLTKRCGGRRLD